MKKTKHCFLAIMLAASILVGIVPVYVNAGDTAVASSQDTVPEIGENTNIFPVSTGTFPTFQSNFAFNGYNVVLPDSYIKDKLTENTWAFSTTLNLSEVGSEGPAVSIAKGTYDGKDECRVNLELRKEAYYLWCATGEPYEQGTFMTSGDTGVTLQANTDYQLTMKVSNRELLQCWLGNKLIVEISLKDRGFTNVTPCFGWRSSNAGTGNFKNNQYWEVAGITDSEITDSEMESPEIGYNTNLLSSIVSSTFPDFQGELPFPTSSGLDSVRVNDTYIKDKIKGNTWAFSTTLNLSEVGSEGPAVSIAQGTYNGEAECRVRLEIRNGMYVLYRATGEPYEYGTQMQSGNTGVTLQANTDYQLTMKVSDGELLQCWLDGKLIAEIALKGRGFTNVTPCFAWRCTGQTGSFENNQFWEDSGIVAPEFENNTNLLSSIVSSTFPDFQGELPFPTSSGLDSVRVDDAYIKNKIQGNTWAFSTTLNLSEVGTEGPAVSIAQGTYNGEAECRVRLEIRNGMYVLYRATGQPYEYGTQMQSGNTGVTLQANTDYQLTMKVSDGELLQCWLGNKLIVEISLKDKGFTNVTPCFAWRCTGQKGSFKNNLFWEGVQDVPVISQYYDVISGYRTNGEYIAPIRTGYVFAGWFSNKACTTPITQDVTGAAYAKFVPENILRVKYQVKENEGKANLCFVTSVDSLKYENVGFEISVGSVTKTPTSTTVYKQVISKVGDEVYYNEPTVFSSASEWFHTYSLTNIPETAYGTEFNVTPCWKTLDGTVVTGKERTVSVTEGLAAVQGQ